MRRGILESHSSEKCGPRNVWLPHPNSASSLVQWENPPGLHNKKSLTSMLFFPKESKIGAFFRFLAPELLNEEVTSEGLNYFLSLLGVQLLLGVIDTIHKHRLTWSLPSLPLDVGSGQLQRVPNTRYWAHSVVGRSTTAL